MLVKRMIHPLRIASVMSVGLVFSACQTDEERTLLVEIAAYEAQLAGSSGSLKVTLADLAGRTRRGCDECATERRVLTESIAEERRRRARVALPDGIPLEFLDSVATFSQRRLRTLASSWSPISYSYEYWAGDRTFTIRSELDRVYEASLLVEVLQALSQIREAFEPQECIATLSAALSQSEPDTTLRLSPDYGGMASELCHSDEALSRVLDADDVGNDLMNRESRNILSFLRLHLPRAESFADLCGHLSDAASRECRVPGGPMTAMEQNVAGYAGGIADILAAQTGVAGPSVQGIEELAVYGIAFRNSMLRQDRLTRAARANRAAASILRRLHDDQAANQRLSDRISAAKSRRTLQQRDSVRSEICLLFGQPGSRCR